MTDDPRYKPLKTIIDSGTVNSFTELTAIYNKTSFRNLLGLTGEAINRRLEDGRVFTFEDVDRISEAVGCDPLALSKIILQDIATQKRNRKKKS